MKNTCLTLSLVLLSLSLFAQTLPWSEVRIHANRQEMEKLARSGLAVDEGFHSKDGTWTTVLSQDELARVQQNGLPYDILHADYSKFIGERNENAAGVVNFINHHKDEFKSTDAAGYVTPQHFHLGSMGGYFTLDEVMNQLDSMRLLYPNLISEKMQAGNNTTIEGRTVYYVMISNNPNQVTGKPRVFFNSLTHAREVMGMQQLIYYMWYLLENYSTSDEVRYLVDNLQIFFIPVVNPDGFQYNCSTTPSGGGMWRKNRRDNGGGAWGVDLNRNYGYKWGCDNQGSSPDPTSETYRGTGPFSEPETQIIRDFSTTNNFVVTQNFHTYADDILYPWCWQAAMTPDSAMELAFTGLMTRENGYKTGVPADIMYPVNGDALDWQYGEQTTKSKSICFTTEIGIDADGFWPFANRIIPLCEENLYHNLMITHLALRYAEAHDVSPVILSSRQGFFKFEFERYGLDAPADYTVSLRPLDSTQFVSWGGTKAFYLPQQLQPYPDSIAYLLNPDVTSGDAIRFLYEVNNGLYTFHDTVVKYFGPPLVIFSDSCSTMGNWTSAKWGVSTTQYHSAPGSITDSPTGNYGNNKTVTVSAINPLNLKNSPVAVISFWTKYRTEKFADFVQFDLKRPLGSWQPQKGKYTRTSFYTEADKQPLYDGFRNDWVQEQIVATDPASMDLSMQFLLKSDMSLNYDGFYFDDFTVTVVDMTKVGTRSAGDVRPAISGPVPNPATGEVTVAYDLQPYRNAGQARFTLMNSGGNAVMEIPVSPDHDRVAFSVSGLPQGVYFYRISGNFGTSEVKKLVVIH